MPRENRNTREGADTTYIGLHVDADTLRIVEGYREQVCPYLTVSALLQHCAMQIIREHVSVQDRGNVDGALTAFWQQGCDAYPLSGDS